MTGRRASAVLAALLGLAALGIAWRMGIKGVGGVPDATRGVAAALVLFGVCGYAPARLLVPTALWAHLPFFALGLGGAVACVGLTVLGFCGLPIEASLAVLLGAGAVAGGWLVVRHGRAQPAAADREAAGGRWWATLLPAYLALVLVALCLTPIFQAGYGSVPGSNPDGMLSVGTAEFLQNSGPRSVNPPLPVDQMPPVWGSKYPIYYGLAGAATLSGVDTVRAYGGFAAVLAALSALGFFVLARYTLRASPPAAVLALALTAFALVTPYLAIHPYFNQLWGAVALPFMLLFGLRFLEAPNRREGGLLVLFSALGLSAYPLMVVFPAVAFLGAVVSLRRRGQGGRLRLPRLPRGRWLVLWIPLALLMAPAALIVGLGVLEKSVSATKLMLGGDDLAAWRGDLTYFPGPELYLGPRGPAGYVVAVLVLVAAVLGLRRAPATARYALGGAVAVGLALGLLFRLRTYGEYFDFKVLAFTTPLVLVAAAPWLTDRLAGTRSVGRYAAVGAVVVVLALQLAGLRDQLGVTGIQVDRDTMELRQVARTLPPGSIRLDVPPGGLHLWAAYYLNERRLSSYTPVLFTTYPHVPGGRKADFIVADRTLKVGGPWPDADGKPLWQNKRYRIYRMKSSVPGPDRSSRKMQDDFGAAF